MASEEKRAWIMGLVAVVGYGAYLAVVLARLDGGPVAETPYRAALLWTVAGGIVAGIVLNIAVAVVSRDGDRKDERDREIHRYGEYVGQSFVVIGGVAALALAMAEADPFWIANAVYLAFTASAVLGSVTKIVAYRAGFQGW